MKRISIVQGEYRVVTEPNVMLTTMVGSCITVCLQDNIARIGGMNHFLLSEPSLDSQLSEADMQRYGVHAMELLINEMMKNGAARPRLRAHLYGGAKIVAGLGAIGSANAAFARSFLRTEEIAIGFCDVGGRQARKVEFLPYEGKARCTAVSAPIPVAPMPPRIRTGELELF